jgi:hypothetical protein
MHIRLLQVFLLGWLLPACSPTDAPFDSKPNNVESARALAERIASKANCAGFEDYDIKQDYMVFTCQMAGENPPMFALWVFYDKAAKTKIENELSLKQDEPFKSGTYYLISEFSRTKIEGKNLNDKIEITAKDFASFPGHMVLPATSGHR